MSGKTNPISTREVATVLITSNSLDFQLIRAPHASPHNMRKLRIKKVIITHLSGKPTTVVFSDVDGSDSAAATRGSANNALLALSIQGTVLSGFGACTGTFDENELVEQTFEAGCVVQGTIGTYVSASFEAY